MTGILYAVDAKFHILIRIGTKSVQAVLEADVTNGQVRTFFKRRNSCVQNCVLLKGDSIVALHIVRIAERVRFDDWCMFTRKDNVLVVVDVRGDLRQSTSGSPLVGRVGRRLFRALPRAIYGTYMWVRRVHSACYQMMPCCHTPGQVLTNQIYRRLAYTFLIGKKTVEGREVPNLPRIGSCLRMRLSTLVETSFHTAL